MQRNIPRNEFIRKMRIEKRLTNLELATLSGYDDDRSVREYQRQCNNQRTMRTESQIKMANALGVSVEELNPDPLSETSQNHNKATLNTTSEFTKFATLFPLVATGILNYVVIGIITHKATGTINIFFNAQQYLFLLLFVSLIYMESFLSLQLSYTEKKKHVPICFIGLTLLFLMELIAVIQGKYLQFLHVYTIWTVGLYTFNGAIMALHLIFMTIAWCKYHKRLKCTI